MNNKETTATTTTVTITKRPALILAAPGAVMVAATIAVALLGLHIQILCLQFIYVILNHLKVSRHFELAGKIWDRIWELHNGFGRNLDDHFNSHTTTKVLMGVSQD